MLYETDDLLHNTSIQNLIIFWTCLLPLQSLRFSYEKKQGKSQDIVELSKVIEFFCWMSLTHSHLCYLDTSHYYYFF